MNTPGWFAEFFRSIFAALDSLGYWLLEGIYDVFFAVANAEILSGDTMNDLYLRLQLIFGVFMIFKLSLTILNIIINPDNYKDKQKGAGTIVVRIAVMLIMLTLIIPINFPNNDGNPLNERINENGILFGFLYQFQDSVINENVLGKLILGSNVDNTADSNNMSDMGGMMALMTAKAFMTPTLINEDAEITTEDSFTEENTACYSDLNAIHYFDNATKPSYLLDHINDTCENSDAGGEVFAMQYTIIGGFVFSLVMGIIVLGFTVDVAVRSIKLAVLRIIAPVPIISYITPGAEKDGAFGNWVKTLTSTYLDLFIRLAVISFGAYIIVMLMDSDGGLNVLTTSTNWFTSSLATIFVILGILVFMKQAPKFFKDVFGIKGDGHLFSGVGAALGGAALLGGIAGSVATNARAAWGEGAEFRDKAQSKLGLMGRSALTGLGAFGSSIAGGIGGAYAGGKALMTSDKKVPSSVMSAMNKRNVARASHSTLPGRISSGAFGMFTGRTLAEKDQQVIDLNKAAIEKISAYDKAVEEEALKDSMMVSFAANDEDVAEVLRGRSFNYQDLVGRMQSKDTNGNFQYNGETLNVGDFNPNVMESIKKRQKSEWTASKFVDGKFTDPHVATEWDNLKYALNQADIKYSGEYLDPAAKGPTIGQASSNISKMQTGMKHIKHIANHQQNK